MYIVIGTTEYHNIRNLSFAPQTDVAGVQLPINTFSADIITGDTIPTGVRAYLLDDLGQNWAWYWVSDALRENSSVVHLTAQSEGYLLDRREMPAVMYNEETLYNILLDALSGSGVSAWAVDQGLAAKTLSGFCPKQKARERALWAIFTAGGYVKDYNTSQMEIYPIDTTETLVPVDRVLMRPAVKTEDWVTSVRVRAYSFTSGTPAVTDEWVKAGNSVWIVSWQDYTLANPDAPSGAEPNEVAVTDCMLINADNVSDILTHLSKYHFDRVTVEADVINNREYEPGQKLSIYTREDQIVTGFCTRAAFSFGVQAVSRLRLQAAQLRETAQLHFVYKYGDRILDQRDLCLPVGYSYSITNPYFDQLWNGERVVFRPIAETATGTVASGGGTVTVNYAQALVLSAGVLDVISVDTVTQDGGEVSV